MSARGARRLLFVAALLLVPLPYLIVVEGSVPVVRFALLGLVTAAYAGFVDGSGVAWPMVGILLGHALVYALGLWAVAAALGRVLPARVRTGVALGLVLLGFAGALSFDLYRTPFAASAAQTSWPGLFR